MTQRQRQRTRRGSRRRPRSLLLRPPAMVGVIAAVVFLSVVGFVVAVAATTPNIDQLRENDPGASSVVYAADGSRLGYVQSDEIRTPVGWDAMPASLRRATVAIEDQRFMQHHGVDFEGVVRAAVKNFTSGKTVQGGSTITQQLVRAIYIQNEGRT